MSKGGSRGSMQGGGGQQQFGFGQQGGFGQQSGFGNQAPPPQSGLGGFGYQGPRVPVNQGGMYSQMGAKGGRSPQNSFMPQQNNFGPFQGVGFGREGGTYQPGRGSNAYQSSYMPRPSPFNPYPSRGGKGGTQRPSMPSMPSPYQRGGYRGGFNQQQGGFGQQQMPRSPYGQNTGFLGQRSTPNYNQMGRNAKGGMGGISGGQRPPIQAPYMPTVSPSPTGGPPSQQVIAPPRSPQLRTQENFNNKVVMPEIRQRIDDTGYVVPNPNSGSYNTGVAGNMGKYGGSYTAPDINRGGQIDPRSLYSDPNMGGGAKGGRDRSRLTGDMGQQQIVTPPPQQQPRSMKTDQYGFEMQETDAVFAGGGGGAMGGEEFRTGMTLNPSVMPPRRSYTNVTNQVVTPPPLPRNNYRGDERFNLDQQMSMTRADDIVASMGERPRLSSEELQFNQMQAEDNLRKTQMLREQLRLDPNNVDIQKEMGIYRERPSFLNANPEPLFRGLGGYRQ